VTRSRAVLAPIVLTLVLGGCDWSGRDYPRFRVPSDSMRPTLKIGDRVQLDRGAYRSADPKRGDIVIFNPPSGATAPVEACGVRRPARSACPAPTPRKDTLRFIKRVVAVPGDRLAIRGNRVYLNGRLESEPFVRTEPCTDACNLPREIVIAPGDYFMLGDNRGESEDSRFWGPVPGRWILGKVRGH
jgi:signal peptidase I